MILILRVCLLLLSACSILAFIACKEDNGASSDSARPIINSITPAQVFAGQTNVRAVIAGSNFTGFGSVDMGPGIEVLKTKLVSSTEIVVRIYGPDPMPIQVLERSQYRHLPE